MTTAGTIVKSAEVPAVVLRRASLPPFVRKLLSSKSTVFGLAIITIVLLAAIIGPMVAPVDPAKQDLALRRAGPGPDHPLGMDEFGRDMLSRMLVGARYTVMAGLLSVAIALAGGVPLGLCSGFLGGRVDEVLMGLVDGLLALPYLLLAIVLVSVMQPSLQSAVVAVGITLIPSFGRIVRGAVLVERGRDYIVAARGLGCMNGRILLRHILPNVAPPIIVTATVSCATTILSTAGLGFLGLGAQPPLPEWGLMVAGGRSYVLDAPHIVAIPGLGIAILVLSINLFGDGLRDALDPQTV